MSDGWLIYSQRNQNAKFFFKQSLSHSAYVWLVFSILSHYCSSCPNITTGVRAGKRYYGLQFFTRALPCFTELYSLFYPNGIKEIPQNIYELLTPVALAHLIMGDGVARPHGLHICTDSYSLPCTVWLMNAIIMRYGLDCTLHTKRAGQYRIYISHSSKSKLESIVSPYMGLSMMYKINSTIYANRLNKKS